MSDIEQSLLHTAYEMQQMRYDLRAIQQAHDQLGAPATAWSSIHVGGTNGKGSVATKIAAALQEEGKNVGLYTSPHLFDLKERIQVNGQPVDHIRRWIEPVIPFQLTFFETLTLAAFLAFQEIGVDIAVIEVGLGGRLDATNLIQPELAVITSIGRDHMHILGSSLEDIAREKAGIVKSGIPIVLGPTAGRYPCFTAQGNPVHYVAGPFSNFEEENRAIAQRALQCLDIMPSSKALASLPKCRFERHQNVVLDVAHNVPGLEALLARCSKEQKPLRVVAGFSADKEVPAMIAAIHRYTPCVHLTQATHPRAFRFHDIPIEQTLHDAWDMAQHREELLVICGSFFLMPEVYVWAHRQGILNERLSNLDDYR